MKIIRNDIDAYVLAGGKSSRMGRDKGLVPLKDMPMVWYAINSCNSVFERVVLVANNQDYHHLGVPVIPDAIADKGPVGGIYTALNSCSAPWILIMSCDMPFVTWHEIRFLCEHVTEDVNVVVSVSQGKRQPMFALYSKRIIHLLEECIQHDDLKMGYILEQTRVREVDFDLRENRRENAFHNINSSEQFDNALIRGVS